jgi:hypothetical protein
MELGQFVEEALVQIVKGIREANDKLEPGKEKAAQPFFLHHSLGDHPQAPHIEFDVAVTTQSKGGGGAKVNAKLHVVSVGLDGSYTGAKESVSRVKFSVVVKLHQG